MQVLQRRVLSGTSTSHSRTMMLRVRQGARGTEWGTQTACPGMRCASTQLTIPVHSHLHHPAACWTAGCTRRARNTKRTQHKQQTTSRPGTHRLLDSWLYTKGVVAMARYPRESRKVVKCAMCWASCGVEGGAGEVGAER